MQGAGGEDWPGRSVLWWGSIIPSRCTMLPYYLCAHLFFYKMSSKCFYHKLGYIFQYK